MAVTISRLAIDLLIDATGMQKGLNAAMKSTRKFGREMTALGKDLSMKVTAPIAGIGIASLKVAGDFEAGMNRVGAITQTTGDHFEALRDKAKSLGATTQFSATEAAGAIEMLGKNGLKYEAILGGSLEATLKLAAATGADLSRAADIGTDAMAAFNIQAGKMEQAVNAITGVTLNSKFDIEAYNLALANGGAVAGSVGVSFEEFNASIAAMAPAFSSGMTAGTAFKTFLTRLQPQSDKAEAAMKTLGLEFFDASGRMKNMADVAGELQKAFKGLSEADRIEMAKNMFGTEGMQAAFALARAGKEEILRLNEAINATSASDQAAARLQGLNGALTKLKSATEALAIAIADSGLLDGVTRLVEKATALFSSLSQTNPAMLKLATGVAVVAAAIGPALIVFGQLATATSAILALIGGKVGLMAAFAALTGPIGLTVAAVAALTGVYLTFKDEIDAFLGGVWQEMVAGWEALPVIIDAVGISMSNWLATQKTVLDGLLERWSRTGKKIALTVEQMVVAIEGWLIDKFQKIADKAADITSGISNSFRWLKDQVVGNSWVPDMIDGIAAETRRLANVFQAPIEKQNAAISKDYAKLAADVAGIELKPKTTGPTALKGNPFIFGLGNDEQAEIKKTLQRPFETSIGRPLFKTEQAEKSIAEAAQKVANAAEAPLGHTVQSMHDHFSKVGDSVADTILGMVDQFKDGKIEFESLGRSFESVLSKLSTAFKAPELTGQGGLLSILSGLGGSGGSNPLGGLGNIFNPAGSGSSQSSIGGLGNIFSGTGGLGGILDSVLGRLGLGGLFNGLPGAGGSLGSILDGFLSNGSGGQSSILDGLLGSTGGGLLNMFGGFFADGGNPPVGKVSMVGERGPELILPRSSTTVVPLDKIQANGGGKSIVVNVSQTNHIEQSGESDNIEARLAKHSRELTATIIDGIQRGGTFARAFQG